ncbi:MAG: HD domain-containing protein [Elainellaceae cyanobacterium]
MTNHSETNQPDSSAQYSQAKQPQIHHFMTNQDERDEPMMGLVLKATHFAAQKHKDQRRKGQDAAPYINHPIALAHLLWHTAQVRDPVVITAALLHDTVEDTDATLDEIEQEFGAEVKSVVAEVTDDKSLPQAVRKQQQIDHAPHLSDRARLVKLADKISNLTDLLRDPPIQWSIERQQTYFQWAKAVIDPIRGSHSGLEEIFDQIYHQGIEALKLGDRTP